MDKGKPAPTKRLASESEDYEAEDRFPKMTTRSHGDQIRNTSNTQETPSRSNPSKIKDRSEANRELFFTELSEKSKTDEQTPPTTPVRQASLSQVTTPIAQISQHRLFNTTLPQSSQWSPASQSSKSSASINYNPEVTYIVSSNSEVFFSIPATRSKTPKNFRQGDHVTPYSSFLYLLFNHIQYKPFSAILTSLEQFLTSCLGPDLKREFELRREEFVGILEAAKENNDSGKQIRATLRQLTKEGTGENNDKEKLENLVINCKETYKFYKNNAIASVIAKIGTLFLNKINKLHDISIFNDAATTKSEDSATSEAEKSSEAKKSNNYSASGSRIRSEIHFLNLVNLAAKRQNCQDQKIKSKMTDDFLKTTTKSDQKKYSELLESELNELRTIKSDIEEKLQENSKKLLSEIATSVGAIFDYKYNDQDQNSASNLLDLFARHIVIIFNAFDDLGFLLKNEQCRTFMLKKIIEHELLASQHWEYLQPAIKPDDFIANLSELIDFDRISTKFSEASRADKAYVKTNADKSSKKNKVKSEPIDSDRIYAQSSESPKADKTSVKKVGKSVKKPMATRMARKNHQLNTNNISQ